MRPTELAERDGWICWLCEGPIDPDALAGSPGAASVDHVVPKSRGGSNDPDNLKAAHRRCNGRRGNSLPEMDWPDRFAVVDAAPLWQSIARLMRHPGRREIVALLPTRELAEEAAAWSSLRAERFVGGTWRAVVEPMGASGELCALKLSVAGPLRVPDAGRPVVTNERRGRRR